jgi:FAD/FMN-containing dehydrogenase
VNEPLLAALREVVGPAHVLTEPDVRAGYEVDWTGRWRGSAEAVVRPGNVAEVAAVLGASAAAGVTVVPQGGNTGLVGGGVPRADAVSQIVLSLVRLDERGRVDGGAAQVSAGAGVTLTQLQAHAGAAGLMFAVDLTARQSATVGGMVATNAGGLHVLRYGSMRAQVVGIEAVLADGSVLSRMGGLVKDNSGYDLAGLLCGSEGTLAVVTGARLRLWPRPTHRVTALLGLADLPGALSVLSRLRSLDTLEAVEVMFDDGIELVCAHAQLAAPFSQPHPCVLVVECAGLDDPTNDLAGVLSGCPEVLDTAVASDSGGRQRLWSWREAHTEAVNALGIPHKLDVSLPAQRMAEFEGEVRALVTSVALGSRLVLWGHLGDGNLHVNVVGPPPDDESVDEAVLRLVADLGGSISAEHGIGVAKRRWLSLTRSSADVAVMTAVKRAFDPTGMLNPGVLLPAGR